MYPTVDASPPRAIGPPASDAPPRAQRVAWALLGAYAAVADASFEEMQATLLKGLGAVTGTFALVMHDRVRHRVVAARDKSGGQQLLWGVTADAALIFSTSTESAIDQALNPQAFPAGCCFVSDVDGNAYNVFVKNAWCVAVALLLPANVLTRHLSSAARGRSPPSPARPARAPSRAPARRPEACAATCPARTCP